MKSIFRARTPIIALAFIGMAVLFIASCTTNEVEIPGLTGPSGSRLFITIEASPDKVFIKTPNKVPNISRITLQLKNQLGQGVPNARIAVRLTNAEGSEVSIGSLDKLIVTTDAAGFARVTYTAPSTAEQPVPVQVFIRAIMTDPAFAFEVVSTHAIDLELQRPFDCVAGPGSPVPSIEIIGDLVEDEQVCFDASGTTDNGTIISFTWDFGDGGTASGAFACHTFTSQGTFLVTLTVVDEDQNCVTLSQFVTIGEGGAPSCTFTVSPNPVNTDTQVFFDASASTDPDGQIVSFRWNFGDGSTGSGERVTHVFDEEGSFTVTLIVTDNAGNETVCTQTVTVSSGLPDCPTIDIDPDPASVGEQVTFTISDPDVDPDGGTVSFSWDLDNDGSFDDGEGTVVTFTYTTEGVKVIRLRVVDDEGNVVICLDSLTVGNVPPECSFTASPNPAGIGDTINFNASASTDPDGTIASFTWDFGDGTPPVTETDPNISHIYATEGSFIVTLTVTDNVGDTATCTVTVTIGSEPPTCAFTVSPNPAGTGDIVNFNGSASADPDGTIVSWTWDFGDGTPPVTEADPITTHVYLTTGTFTATLTVTDNDGNTTSCTQTVTISQGAAPTCSASGSPNPAAVGQTVNFTGTANDPDGDPLTFNWNFGDGGTAATQNTSHVYNSAGNFTVTFTVTDSTGLQCVDEFVMVISGPTLVINNVAVAEGDAGTTILTFTVSLSGPAPSDVSANFATADGDSVVLTNNATVADGDYVATAGVVNIPTGGTTDTIDVTINGDLNIESNEFFIVNLSNAVGATISDPRGEGTINNDD